jgi:hypothetical protein
MVCLTWPPFTVMRLFNYNCNLDCPFKKTIQLSPWTVFQLLSIGIVQSFAITLTSNSSGTIIKLQFTLDGQQTTHNVKFDRLEFSELQHAASSRLGSAIENIVLEYTDSEGDRVRLERNEDFTLAIEETRQANTRLRVSCSLASKQAASGSEGHFFLGVWQPKFLHSDNQ